MELFDLASLGLQEVLVIARPKDPIDFDKGCDYQEFPEPISI
jgi:hypothetical protein